jgi:hypothetical protein
MNRDRLVYALAMAALAAILVPSSLPAQITFERTYGGALGDGGGSIQQTADGGYIITGSTKSYGAGDADIYLIKTDARGDTLWSKAFGGADVDYGYDVQQTTDSGYVMTGVTFSFGAGMGDIWLIKTDAFGDTLWARTIGDTNPQWGYEVRQTVDGGYIVVGCTGPYGSFAAYLIKTGADGDTLWTRTFAGGVDCSGYAVQQTADSGYILAGYEWPADGMYLVKTDVDGDTEWTRTYGGVDFDEGQSVQQTSDGGYIIAGDTRSFGAGGSDVYLVKTDAQGDTQWTRTFGGVDEEWGYSVQQATDSGYIVAGQTRSFGAGDYDVFLIRTDSGGDTLWTRTFGGAAEDGGSSVRQTADGGCVIGGGTNSYGVGGDVYLIKTNADGNVAVAEPKASPTRAPALSLTCEPNPVVGTTTIRTSFIVPRSSLSVYDAQGRMVLSREVSTSSFPLSTSDLPSGAYFLRLDADGHRATARIVLQR